MFKFVSGMNRPIKYSFLHLKSLNARTDIRQFQIKSFIKYSKLQQQTITIYTGCTKKIAERRIFSTLRAKSVISFHIILKSSSAKEIDTKIIEFG